LLFLAILIPVCVLKYFFVFILSVVVQLFFIQNQAQESIVTDEDSLVSTVELPSGSDSLTLKMPESNIGEEKKSPLFKPNPKKAVIYSAIFPGLGQIYNRKYWKLPLVYGGFLGCAYAITWNGDQYNGYKQAYNDIQPVQDNPNVTVGTSWINYLPYGTDPESVSAERKTQLANSLKRQRDFYRRYRDLSIFVTVGVYALCMIDAYVDAQLFDFDISPDLGMRVEPVLFQKSIHNHQTAVGLQCGFKF
jgi:hypothetical protein